jgi:excisionase family DNA binding protein
MPEDKLLISRQEACTLLGISLRTLDSILAAKQLESRRVGRRRLIPRRALERFVARDHGIVPQGTKNL